MSEPAENSHLKVQKYVLRGKRAISKQWQA
jgi:hypothetical protein